VFTGRRQQKVNKKERNYHYHYITGRPTYIMRIVHWLHKKQ